MQWFAPTDNTAMTMTYWLDLFSGETWDEFLAHGSDVPRFRIGRWGKAANKRLAAPRRQSSDMHCVIEGRHFG